MGPIRVVPSPRLSSSPPRLLSPLGNQSGPPEVWPAVLGTDGTGSPGRPKVSAYSVGPLLLRTVHLDVLDVLIVELRILSRTSDVQGRFVHRHTYTIRTYVYRHVPTHPRAHARTYTPTHTHVHTRTYTPTRTHTCPHMYNETHTHVWSMCFDRGDED